MKNVLTIVLILTAFAINAQVNDLNLKKEKTVLYDYITNKNNIHQYDITKGFWNSYELIAINDVASLFIVYKHPYDSNIRLNYYYIVYHKTLQVKLLYTNNKLIDKFIEKNNYIKISKNL